MSYELLDTNCRCCGIAIKFPSDWTGTPLCWGCDMNGPPKAKVVHIAPVKEPCPRCPSGSIITPRDGTEPYCINCGHVIYARSPLLPYLGGGERGSGHRLRGGGRLKL